jgi:carboxyl-terminal processing protease
MNKNTNFYSRLTRLVSVVLFLALLLVNLVSCGTAPSDFVTSYLEEMDGIPEFSKSKLKGVEIVYRDYYVYDIPPAEEFSKKVADIYFENFKDEIDPTNASDVTDALIYSYIAAVGDKYSVYRTASEYEDYNTDLSGEFYGIGVVVTYDYVQGTLTVTEVLSGGGASDAGIKVGDLIHKVDGELVSEIGYSKAINMVRGENGTTVKITVLRDGNELEFTVTRKKVVEESVSYSIDENKIAYIKISSFKENTVKQFKDAIDDVVENGAVGIIYDLRSNPGGYLSTVVSMISMISPKGATIVSFSNDYGPPVKDSNHSSLELPTVVICNENTASAAELFTAAMRDFGDTFEYFDVTLVGTKTFGKGIMQSTYLFTDDSSITLTVAFYNPPSGINYDGIGITPDVIVTESESGDAQLEAAYNEISKMIK